MTNTTAIPEYLTIAPSFIKKYDLELLLNHDPYYTVFITNNDATPFNLTLRRFLYNVKLDDEYLSHFIDLFKQFLKKYNAESHVDRLLFLSLAYKVERVNKSVYNAKHRYFRDQAKAIYDLVATPVFNITMKKARQLLIDNGEDEYNIDEIILTYLHVVTGKHTNEFKGVTGNLDNRKISNEEKRQVIHKIAEQYAASIEMANGKTLYISGSIRPSLHYSVAGKKSIQTVSYHKKLMVDFVTHILNIQKSNNTPFYNALLEFDFYTQSNLPMLRKTLTNYGKSSYHAFLIKRIRTLLHNYLDNEKVLERFSKENRSIKRDDFVYEYLTLLGLINADAKEYKSTEDLDRKWQEINKKRSLSIDFARTYFSDALKNIPDTETTNENPTWIELFGF